MLAYHPYDIIYFDFCKAFDKVPHQCVVDAAKEHGIGGKALAWIGNFLIGRTQQVKIREYLSEQADVISGTIQGSVLGPISYVYH